MSLGHSFHNSSQDEKWQLLQGRHVTLTIWSFLFLIMLRQVATNNLATPAWWVAYSLLCSPDNNPSRQINTSVWLDHLWTDWKPWRSTSLLPANWQVSIPGLPSWQLLGFLHFYYMNFIAFSKCFWHIIFKRSGGKMSWGCGNLKIIFKQPFSFKFNIWVRSHIRFYLKEEWFLKLFVCLVIYMLKDDDRHKVQLLVCQYWTKRGNKWWL